MRDVLRRWRRTQALRRGLRTDNWELLTETWGNSAYATRRTYLAELAARARKARFVLECGSGLSTLVLAKAAADVGSELWTLEHNDAWYRTVLDELRRLRLIAHVVHAPLRSYAEYDWYDVELAGMPAFDLVLCDGPPESTPGGRYGPDARSPILHRDR